MNSKNAELCSFSETVIIDIGYIQLVKLSDNNVKEELRLSSIIIIIKLLLLLIIIIVMTINARSGIQKFY